MEDSLWQRGKVLPRFECLLEWECDLRVLLLDLEVEREDLGVEFGSECSDCFRSQAGGKEGVSLLRGKVVLARRRQRFRRLVCREYLKRSNFCSVATLDLFTAIFILKLSHNLKRVETPRWRGFH